MDREKFEEIAERAFEALPKNFRERIENVEIVVQDEPSSDPKLRRFNVRRDEMLLGLYQGVPLTHRGTWYGMTPVLPDRITLFQKNIEAVCRTEVEIEEKIYEVLFHEIGHYFGMNEEEIRNAMRDWRRPAPD
jgi:predicted Zn-dependent protease with MMP-like domain